MQRVSSKAEIEAVLLQRFARDSKLPLKDSAKVLKDRFDFDQVYSRIYISGSGFAQNPKAMMDVGITHCLNMAEGSGMMRVDTNEEFYKDSGIKYLGVTANDTRVYDLSQHFDESTAFIHKALSENETNAVLVHCLMGISRSTTAVIAYLMSHESLPADEALKRIRQNRHVYPNSGFVQQLVAHGEKLNKAENKGKM